MDVVTALLASPELACLFDSSYVVCAINLSGECLVFILLCHCLNQHYLLLAALFQIPSLIIHHHLFLPAVPPNVFY